MSNTDKKENANREPVSRSELVELVLEPLSSLLTAARLEILEKIQDVEDTIDILARENRRKMRE